MHGIGADLDAGADLAELRRLLVDRDLVSGLDQTGRRGQSAQPRSGNQNLVAWHSTAHAPPTVMAQPVSRRQCGVDDAKLDAFRTLPAIDGEAAGDMEGAAAVFQERLAERLIGTAECNAVDEST